MSETYCEISTREVVRVAEVIPNQTLLNVSVGEVVKGDSRLAIQVLDNDEFVGLLGKMKNALFNISYMVEVRGAQVVIVKNGSKHVAVAYVPSYFSKFPSVPRTRAGFSYDLLSFVEEVCPKMAVEIQLGSPGLEPAGLAEQVADGYWNLGRGVEDRRPETTYGNIITCTSNEFYGHSSILKRFVGMPAWTPILGRVQHGWSPGCVAVLDGWIEPTYVWANRDREMLKKEGKEAKAIGSPFLYLPKRGDPGPKYPRGVLSIPIHSLSKKRVPTWEPYIKDLLALKKTHEPVVVALHYNDFEASKSLFEERGLPVTSFGHIMDPQFLHKLRLTMFQFAHVTSNNICTAGFYALALGRHFFIYGDPLRTDPPDFYQEWTGDPVWIKEHYPVFSRELALRELGQDCLLSKEALDDLLFGWQRK